jgi:hypothetical protein
VRKLRRDKAFKFVEEKHWKSSCMECLNRRCKVTPQEDQFHREILGSLVEESKRKSTVRILWRRLEKSRQPLDLPKKQGGYGRVRSSSSRGREPLDLDQLPVSRRI